MTKKRHTALWNSMIKSAIIGVCDALEPNRGPAHGGDCWENDRTTWTGPEVVEMSKMMFERIEYLLLRWRQ